MIEKPYLHGNIKLDEAAIKKVFLYNLNKTYSTLTELIQYLPVFANDACYGDLQNAIIELQAETNNQLYRLDNVFLQLKEAPSTHKADTPNLLSLENSGFLDGLSKDLFLVFHIQQILNINRHYFQVLKSIAGLLNQIDIKIYLQYCYDECEDNLVIFKLIAKEYMESSINTYLN